MQAKKHIFNFSNIALSDDEILLLGKGLKFVPSPSFKRLKINLLRDFDVLSRKMRCKYELDDGKQYELHPFYVHSNYTPQSANNAIETYLFNTKLEIDNMILPRIFSNLTRGEWLALKTLKSKVNITIKCSDKTSCITILNTDCYITEGRKHLNNIHYQKIDHLSTETHLN